MLSVPNTPPSDARSPWRNAHLGHWLRQALERFERRTMELMANDPGMPLGLANLAARGQVGAAHLHLTRHLPVGGGRLTELAQAAGISKQSMGALVTECEAWGMVQRENDPTDARARRIVFTQSGMAWLQAYHDAAAQAQREMQDAIGIEVCTVIALGLEAYGGE